MIVWVCFFLAHFDDILASATNGSFYMIIVVFCNFHVYTYIFITTTFFLAAIYGNS